MFKSIRNFINIQEEVLQDVVLTMLFSWMDDYK